MSGSHALPPVRERSEATARTMLAKTPPPTGPGVPVMPVHTRPGATPQLPEVVVQKAGDFLRKVHPKWVAAGCGGLFVLGMMLTIAVASIGGDDEPGATESEGDEGGISLTETFQELVPIARPEPSIPPEVQERIDVVLHEGERRERLRAAEWLLEHEPAADVPEFGRVAAELELARGCRGKKPIVERIREQGLVGTLPALERLDGSRRGCGFFGRADCYRCMRRELSETIDALRGEEPPPEEP